MSKENKKKLLITASTFPRWEGDTEPRFVLDLASHMTEAFDITVLVPMAIGAKEREMMDGVTVVRYHYFPIHRWETLCYPGAIVPRIKEKKLRVLLVPFLLIALYFHLLKMIKQFDVVHAHWIIPQGIVQSLFKKPFIVTGHGGDVTSLNKGILRIWKRYCLKKASHITVVSKHLKSEVMKIYDKANVQVISMGCNMKQFGKAFYIPNYFNQGSKKVVLFVGRLAEKKGVAYLIDAFREIDAILVIVGDGPLKESLVKQAEKVKNKVVFLGAKSHQELKEIYASADIFVLPSVIAKDGDQEGFGVVILEAMASEIPIVASDSGGIAELICDGETGLLFKEKNVAELRIQIKRLLCDEALCKKLKDNAAKRILQFDYETIGKKYGKILNLTNKNT